MKCKYLTLLASMFAMFLLGTTPALAATPPSLGAAANFAALGGAGVTCTSPSPPLPAITVTGDVGSFLAAHSSVTGFPGFTPGANRCSLSGTVQLRATAAFANFTTAYGTLADIPCPTDAQHLLSGELGGMVLSPGVYCISGVGTLTGQLTLDLTLGGPSDGIWIFKAAESVTPIGGSVVMANGGSACNVYWQVGAASFVNTQFLGNVLSGSAITFNGTNSSLAGRALAKTDVTMTGASISLGNCGGGTQPPSCKPDKHEKSGKSDKHDDKHDKQNCHGNHDGHDQDDDDDDDDDEHDD